MVSTRSGDAHQVRKCLSWFYGDCPAGRAWHKTLKSTLHSADEAPTATERCVFVHDAAIEPTHNAITAAVVDDINNLATCPELHTKLHDALERDFEMKRDDAGFILGYQCSRIAGGDITINQHGYQVRMLERYYLPQTHVDTPALCSVHLEGTEHPCDDDVAIVQAVAGSLQYLRRPDIAFALKTERE